jgi:1-acyl-sn-glycerol-3-phosphate acyltransferase
MGLSIAQIFLVAAILNALVAVYIFTLVPEFLMRFITWLLIHTLYRVEKSGLDNIPQEGPVVLAANHVSFVDPLIIGGCVRRPVRFVMYYKIYRLPVLNFVFRTARAIPIAGRNEDPRMFERAFAEMEKCIADGDVLCIFPEGQITTTGEFNPFRPGIEHLLKARPAPVIPVALQGLWGSMFSRRGGPAFFKLPRRLFARIGLVIGELMPAEKVTAALLQQRVLELRGDRR